MFSPRLFSLGLLAAAGLTPASAITITQFNVNVTENFDSLATSTSSTVPAGWSFNETGSGANATYGAGAGTSSTGNTYSFGAASASERAFGTLKTTSVASTLGVSILNATGASITDLAIQYVGEQWRLGAAGRVDQLDFAYSLDATSLTTGTWIDVNALDLVAPVTAGSTGALDGNAAENRVVISHTLSGLTLAAGSNVWLRWTDIEATGSDDGLGVDDFAIKAVSNSAPVQGVPDHLPLAPIVAVLGAILAAGSRTRRRATV